MKHSNVADLDGRKIGNKASKTFANAGKLKNKTRTPSKRKIVKSPPENKTSKTSKAIKKSTSTKLKRKVATAVKQTQLPTRLPRVRNNNKVTSPKVIKNLEVVRSSPRGASSAKVKVKMGLKTLKANMVKGKTLNAKNSKVLAKNVKSISNTNSDTPKVKKLKSQSLIQTIPTKAQKAMQSTSTSMRTHTTRGMKTKIPEGLKTITMKTSSINKRLHTKKVTMTQKGKTVTPKLKTSKIQASMVSPVSKKSSFVSPVASPKHKQKKATKKTTITSVVLNKTTKKKAKSKIKIAGLLGRTETKSTEVKSPVNGSTSKTAKIQKKLANFPTVARANKQVAKKKRYANTPLRVKMMDRLKSARFRYINEELYTKDSAGAVKLFDDDPDAFAAYHEGYRQQVKKWPMNPLSTVIAVIKKMSDNIVVADFGCGDGELAKSVKQKVHSFDLVAANDSVTACDMAHVPLNKNSVDVVVFCLSLMGTNLQDYFLEANRVLKMGGVLIIAEVESRFDNVETFLANLNRYGFTNIRKNFDSKLFYIMHFHKKKGVRYRENLPAISLNPCIYKKR